MGSGRETTSPLDSALTTPYLHAQSSQLLLLRDVIAKGGYATLQLRLLSQTSISLEDLSSAVPYEVIHVAERFLEGVHHYTHLPWWAVIACCTVTLRSLITLPLAVHQNKMLAKMELLTPTLKEFQEAVQHNVISKCRRDNVPYEIANKRVKKELRKVAIDLFRQEGCSPYKVAILPWVQLPLWITLSFALRDMTGVFPNKLPLNPESTLSFASEGVLWFQNLTVADPCCVLPVILAFTNFLNIELHALRRQAPSRVQRIMTNVFRVLTVGMGYVASQLPAVNLHLEISHTHRERASSYIISSLFVYILQALSLYWAVSSSYGLVQNVLFRFPRVRRTLAIPRSPSESKHPYRDLLEIIKKKSQAFVRLQRK